MNTRMVARETNTDNFDQSNVLNSNSRFNSGNESFSTFQLAKRRVSSSLAFIALSIISSSSPTNFSSAKGTAISCGRTLTLMLVRTPRRCDKERMPPKEPGDDDIIAANFPENTALLGYLSLGREAQSMTFFSAAGREPLYSGEAIKNPSCCTNSP